LSNGDSAAPGKARVVIVAPVYRDWHSASILCRELDDNLSKLATIAARVILVDDGSPGGVEGWRSFAPQTLNTIDVLRLRRNLGHQRAIAVGLCYIHDYCPCDMVVVMDADGEDRPEHAIELIKRFLDGPPRIIFAERRKRLEGATFQVGYVLYRVVHRVLTGIPVRVGNFSVLPSASLNCLVSMSETWNHYAGAIFKSKLGYEVVPLDRGRRYYGQSHMDVTSLVNHGLAGIATFHDTVAVRILLASVLAMTVAVLALAVVMGVWIPSRLPIPNWASYWAGFLLLLLIQILVSSFNLVFTLITNRVGASFVPVRDYRVFLDGFTKL
jgi:glycosyltransferase involved in cell wall biosynthesis